MRIVIRYMFTHCIFKIPKKSCVRMYVDLGPFLSRFKEESELTFYTLMIMLLAVALRSLFSGLAAL